MLNAKEKIKLLSNLQSFIDDEDGIGQSITEKYGETVWAVVHEALTSKMESLLGDQAAKRLDALADSPVLMVLEQLAAKLDKAANAAPAKATVQQPQENPTTPPRPLLDSQELSEEEKAEIISRRFGPRGRGVSMGGIA